MKTIARIVGWVLVALGGIWMLSAAICIGLTLAGQQEEASGLLGRVVYSAGYLLWAAPGALVAMLGWRLRRVKSQQPAVPTPEKAAVPVVEQRPLRERKSPAVKAAPEKPATWVTSPGLNYDREPFRACLAEEAGLDSFRDGAACHVYNGDIPLEEAIRLLMPRQERTHVRVEDPAVLQTCSDSLFALCRERWIHIVTYEGDYGLYDHVNNCHLKVHVETWYGSVDDAATYGGWTVEEQQ